MSPELMIALAWLLFAAGLFVGWILGGIFWLVLYLYADGYHGWQWRRVCIVPNKNTGDNDE